MKLENLPILFFFLIFYLEEICGHGKLMEPVNRSSAWRKGFNTTVNYDDGQNYCGGAGIQYGKYGGKCGICGDDYGMNRPRPNENGGEFGTGVIVRRYASGQSIDVDIEISAAHKGFFRFALCVLEQPDQLEEENCFHYLTFADGSAKYDMGKKSSGIYNSKVVLPSGVTCKHCVLRWEYKAGNNWGECVDGSQNVGCGLPETFRTCSDIAIE